MLTGYAGLLEPSWLDVGRHEIKTNRNGQTIKILHLSDFHASWCVSLSQIEQAVQCGLQLKPDLICLTGDFVTTKFEDLDGYSAILSQLSGAAPTFASLGNHDGGHWAALHGGHADTAWTRSLLQKSHIELLHNRSMDIVINDRPIRLVGVGDRYAHEVQPGSAFPGPTAGSAPYCVLLSHNPDTKDVLAPYAWDLMLCGHTHGGQICLPFIGAPFAPVKDQRFIAGLYCWQNRRIHITRGVGNIWGLRFNCRPEVSLLTLS
jgi:hypothetical protein